MGVIVHRATLGVVLAVVMALAGAGAAQAAWSGADSLTTGRYNHAATLLNDGRVLVTGGNDSGPLDSARVFDPATNGWSNAAPMKFARQGHAAVVLQSGKVLVAGGFAPTADPASPASGYTRTAEIYDPAANTWTKAADMGAGRFQPTMTVLHDGRVLVAGGSGDIGSSDGVRAAVPLASVEIYDPAKNSWTDVPSMSIARSLHTATLLPNGDVLVAGGFDDATGQLSSAELYDPSSNQWSPTGSLAEARDSATATALANGDVLVAGGGSRASALASAEIYEPGSKTWRAAARMVGARETAAAALLKDGTVLIAGGEDGRLGNLLDTAERYDPAANAWTDAGAMAATRKQDTLTALDDGRALVVGGNPGGFAGGLAGVERFGAVTTKLTAPSFGSQLVDTPSDLVNSVLTNTANAPLVVTGVSVAGVNASDFAIDSESCLGSSVAPGETCEVRLRFTPSAAGARSATLTVADNTAAGTTTAVLTGSGLEPATAPDATTAVGDAPAEPSGAPVGTTAPARVEAPAATPSAGALAVAGTSARSSHARATCKVKTTRGRSAVTCRVTWPTRDAVALRARLVHGASVLASTRTTARSGRATLGLRLARRLRAGNYTVVIARRDGTVVLRQAIRAS